MKFIGIIVGFTVANLGWQAFLIQPDWKMALERSYFQAVAILYVWFFKVGQ